MDPPDARMHRVPCGRSADVVSNGFPVLNRTSIPGVAKHVAAAWRGG